MKDSEENEDIAYDSSAYEMLHKVSLEWPCLSVDFVLPDRLNINFDMYNPAMKLPESMVVDYKDPVNSQTTKRHKLDKYPYTVYLVGGTQTDPTSKVSNKLYVMKWSNMYKTQYDNDSESDDDPDNLDEDPELLYEWVPLKSSINRVRSMNNSPVTALWTEAGEVAIYDTSALFLKLNSKKVNNKKKTKKKLKDTNCKVRGFLHPTEGYALDWSPLKKGVLASGGHDAKIYTYLPTDTSLADWQMSKTPLQGHTDSVEDLQFSPAEEAVLASCSVDKTVKIWDLRADSSKDSQLTVQAHESDVNVISWNSACTYLLASGGDEGAFKVWDLRYVKRGSPITNVKWHTAPITSIQFQPREESVLAVASADNKLTIWDFAVENDKEALAKKKGGEQEVKDIPEQLMFLHQGQDDIKELRFHPIYDCMLASTAGDGVNLFRPNFNPKEDESSDEENAEEIKEEKNENDSEEELEDETK